MIINIAKKISTASIRCYKLTHKENNKKKRFT